MTTRIQLEPEAQAFADMYARKPFLVEQGPVEGRAALDEIQSGFDPSPTTGPFVDIVDLIIEDGPVEQVSIRILRPRRTLYSSPNPSALLPVIVYIHGAGWVFGNAHTHDRLIRALAVGVGAAVVFPNYSLSPEAKYPTAIEECYAVVKWVAESGAAHGLDAEQLVVAGDGVGGNIAIAVTLMSKERGGPPIDRQLLFYPVTQAAFDTDSYHQFAEGYSLRRDEMQWFWDQYTTHADERNEITASPLRASIEQLQGLPPALIITAEADVLRDEGEAYASKLRAAGVPVTAARFLGTIHDFVMLNALANTAAAQGAITLATGWLRDGFTIH